MKLRCVVAFLCAFLLAVAPMVSFASGFTAEVPQQTDAERVLRGYDPASQSYVYLNFGSYPFYSDGKVAPCLWRVLAIDENGYAFLLNEYVIDRKPFHTIKKDQEAWNQYLLFKTMNTEMVHVMFNADELDCVRWTDELGWIFILDNKEFMTAEYGFRKILTKKQPERKCPATPYSIKMKETEAEDGCTWYWSRSCRHTAGQGYEHIIGYDGHISMGGYLRNGGVRPACYVNLSKLDNVTGSGTFKDPYRFEIVK